MAVGDLPRSPRYTHLSIKVGSSHSVYFACGLKATEFVICLFCVFIFFIRANFVIGFLAFKYASKCRKIELNGIELLSSPQL
jgi:hypothetical protein